MKKKKCRRSKCPINFALEIFGDKWTLLVIRDIVFMKKKSYNEFLESDERIATNILADRLALLEREKIVTKSRDPSNKSRFLYTLTPKGTDLLPLLVEMILWSAEHDPKSPLPKEYVDMVKKDKGRYITTTLQQMKEE